MKNKVISLALVIVLALSAVLTFSGCSESEYPVSIANLKIKEKPEKVVVLDAAVADIISYMGYDVNLQGRSDEVDQEWLNVVPSVGPAKTPDVDAIVKSGATLVFAGDNIDHTIKQELEEAGIQVISMVYAETQKQLETSYVTLGKIFGGQISGGNEGGQNFVNLLEEMDGIKTKVNESMSNAFNTVCYLYFDNNGLKLMTSGTYGDMLLSYTGAVNAAVNIEQNEVDVNTMKVANPNYIFYADESTLDAIRSDKVLSNLTAVKKGKILKISSEEMSRQGKTAINTLTKMVNFMYPGVLETKTETMADSTVNDNNTQATQSVQSTQATTAPVEEEKTIAEQYKIKLDNLSLKYEDENNNVKIMQQRLFDLGYVTDKENITGYYGDISKAAVTEFQKNNDLEETGEADNDTLQMMFSDEAVEAE